MTCVFIKRKWICTENEGNNLSSLKHIFAHIWPQICTSLIQMEAFNSKLMHMTVKTWTGWAALEGEKKQTCSFLSARPSLSSLQRSLWSECWREEWRSSSPGTETKEEKNQYMRGKEDKERKSTYYFWGITQQSKNLHLAVMKRLSKTYNELISYTELKLMRSRPQPCST